MNKIYAGIISVLIIIIICLSTYILIKTGIYKNIINELQTENKSLITSTITILRFHRLNKNEREW